MAQYSLAIYRAEMMGYWVTPDKSAQISELRDLGMKGIRICPGGTSTSYLATKEVIKNHLPCVALDGGMSRAEGMFKGEIMERHTIEKLIIVLNALEIVFLLVGEESAKKNYPRFSGELSNKVFLKKDDASKKLISMYR